ncbi:unnamed protein product, partial [Oppiella nova]
MLTYLTLLFIFTAAYAVPFNPQFEQGFNGKQWVVLAASSNGWLNYGDQADVYHAYHVVRSHGIPDENIILFHYDDIANNKQNPTKGVVVNEPNGTNVYYDIPKERSITGKDITPQLLPKDIDIYVTTAASPDEESYFCCYDEKRDSYVGMYY